MSTDGDNRNLPPYRWPHLPVGVADLWDYIRSKLLPTLMKLFPGDFSDHDDDVDFQFPDWPDFDGPEIPYDYGQEPPWYNRYRNLWVVVTPHVGGQSHLVDVERIDAEGNPVSAWRLDSVQVPTQLPAPEIGDLGHVIEIEPGILVFVPMGGGGAEATWKVKVQQSDLTPDYLYSKVASPDSSIVISFIGAADQTVTFAATGKVKVSDNDQKIDYLGVKIYSIDSSLDITVGNEGGEEYLDISNPYVGKVMVSSDDGTIDFLDAKVEAGHHLTETVLNPAGNEVLQLNESGTRMDSTEGLRVECRTNDPGNPADGRIWLRTDL